MKALTIITFLLTSCMEHFTNNDVAGTYVPINYKNNFDTIQLKSQGVYHRRVFDKNYKLLLEMNGKWSLQANGQIRFNSFYQNLDDDLIKFPISVKDTSMEVITDIESRSGSIQFCVGYYEGENCYRKIK